MKQGFEGHTPEFLVRVRKRMDLFDTYPRDIRDLINIHGLGTVKAFLDIGINSHKHIRHLIAQVRGDSYGNGSKQGHKCPTCGRIETDLPEKV